jgi:hypothetical protein
MMNCCGSRTLSLQVNHLQTTCYILLQPKTAYTDTYMLKMNSTTALYRGLPMPIYIPTGRFTQNHPVKPPNYASSKVLCLDKHKFGEKTLNLGKNTIVNSLNSRSEHDIKPRISQRVCSHKTDYRGWRALSSSWPTT